MVHRSLILSHIALLFGPGKTSPTSLILTHRIRAIMPMVNKLPISPNNSDEHYETLVKRQKDSKHDTPRKYEFFPIGTIVVFQSEDGRLRYSGTVVGKKKEKTITMTANHT